VNKIKPKRSYTANSVPLTSDIDTHELAIRWDSSSPAMFTKDAAGKIVSVTLGSFSLPTASSSILGGIKVGANLTIADGVLSATGGGGSANIVEAATAAGFPATGSAGTLYHAIDKSRIYFWDTSGVYVEVGPK
jgi:hypothetical protein